jgi:pilus assembly protein FimV
VLAFALALAAGSASALGLGQLQVKSKPGQPLVAEIPIISSDPTELQGLQVQLAPPETFSRVGLDAPQGEVSSLRFEPALDSAGRPIIRVTSPEPVQAAALTFLLQVDWSQGRLVREYSALVETPESIAAAAPPPIQAPSVEQPNLITRPAAPAPAPAVAMQPPPAAAPPTPVASRPVAPSTPSPAVAEAPPATPADCEVPQGGVPGQYGPVKAGQTLGQIAASLDGLRGYSTAQAMLALLRANPDAFIGGNVNLIRRGAVLKVPASDEVAATTRSEAARLVHEQIAQWRAARPASGPASQAGDAVATRLPAAANRAAKPTRTVGARLEIAPPSATGRQRAGTQSGLEAGGEGEMLRQQLQETKETLAARDAEVNELKTRVAELEKLQQQQQQLLTMKDSALASAQQTLAKSNNAPAPAAVASQSAPATPPPSTPPQSGGVWLWAGLALIVAALLGWLMTRQRQRSGASPKRNFDTEALAASIPVPAPPPSQPRSGGVVADPFVAPRPAQSGRRTAVADPVAPPWHGDAAGDAADVATSTVGRQLELAQSCLDRGDEDAARVLLREVLDGRDPVARETAARLLRDL